MGVKPRALTCSLGTLSIGRRLQVRLSRASTAQSPCLATGACEGQGRTGCGPKAGWLIPTHFCPQFLSDGYVAHLGQLEAGSHSHTPSGPPRTALAKSSYGVAAPVDFLRKQSQLLRSRGPSQADREGPGTPPTTLARGKARSISLKLDSEE